LRHADGVVRKRLREAQAHEHARQQFALRVGEFGAQADRAGVRVDRHIREKYLAGLRIDAAVFQQHFHAGGFGALEFARLDGSPQAQYIRAGLGEVDVDRVELLDGRQQRGFAPADQRALGHQRAADAPGNRGGDAGVFQILIGADQRGFGLLGLGGGQVVFLLADCLDCQQRLVALDRLARDHQVCPGGLGTCAIGARIDLEQGGARLDIAAFLKQPLFNHSLDARAHLRRAVSLQASRQILRERRAACGYGDHVHLGRRHSRAGACGGFVICLAATGQQGG